MTYIFSVFVVVAGRGLRDGCTCTASAIPPFWHKKLCCLSVVVRDGDVCGWKAAAAVCTASKLISMLKALNCQVCCGSFTAVNYLSTSSADDIYEVVI